MIFKDEIIKQAMKEGKINYKSHFYVLYNAGMLGNKVLSWSSYKELLESDWREGVCLRSKTGVRRKRVDFNVPFDEVPDKIKEWEDEGYSLDTINFNQSMPDPKLVLQGEVSDMTNWWDLTYTRVKKPMNLALEESSHRATGIQAKLIMKEFLDASSYSDIEALFEIFPESGIEFSTYSVPVGDIPNRNTVIWEVRNY